MPTVGENRDEMISLAQRLLNKARDRKDLSGQALWTAEIVRLLAARAA